MKSVNLADLKNHLNAYLSEVRAGQELLVRDRQTPIARILPVAHGAGEDEDLQRLAAQGKVRLGGARSMRASGRFRRRACGGRP
jgi:prevent-host-death family protein